MAFVCVSNNFMSVARQLAMTTEPDRLTRMERAVEHAMEIIKSWVLSKGGSIISDDPCVSIYEVSIHHLGDLKVLVDRFKEHTKLDCWSGVGNTMADSVRAADFAKKKNLDKPFLMQEDIEDHPQEAPLSVLKSEEEELNKASPNDKSLKGVLTGAGIAALLSAGGAIHHLATRTPEPPPITAPAVQESQPKKVEKPKLTPKKATKLNVVPKHLKGTFAENYDPKTLHHGTQDAMWAIGLAESHGGRDLDHAQEIRDVNHPLTGERVHNIDNTAFGHFGMRPFTAMDAAVKSKDKDIVKARDLFVQEMLGKPTSELIRVPKIPLGSGKKFDKKAYAKRLKEAVWKEKQRIYGDATKEFMHRLKTSPEYYNQVAQINLNRLAEKFGEKTPEGGFSNPTEILSAWNRGEYADEDKVKNNPEYLNLVLGRVKSAMEHGVNPDFVPMFGQAGHDALIRAAMEHKEPPKIPKIPKRSVANKR